MVGYLRPIAAAEDQYLEPFGSSPSVASGAGFWLERIGDCDVCAIPVVREVVPTDVNIRVRRIRPSAVRERRSWAIGGRRTYRANAAFRTESMWRAKSVATVAQADDLDLRKRTDARELESLLKKIDIEKLLAALSE